MISPPTAPASHPSPPSTRSFDLSTSIPRFSADVTSDLLASAVRRSGYAIVERFLVDATEQARVELTPYLNEVPRCTGSFTGYRTRRTMRLVVKSMATHEMIVNELIQSTVSELFMGEAYHHQLHFTEAVLIEPGQTAQSLHRDDGTFPFRHPSPPNTLNTIWAADDFTEDNGATRVIPGSHLWGDHRRPREEEAQTVVMPRGSVLIMDGALYHGGGANRSSRSRLALLLAYSLGWLRPAENPQLAVPPPIAKMLSKELQDLLGYRSHGYLGAFEGTQPSASWLEPASEHFAAEDLYTEELEHLQIRRR